MGIIRRPVLLVLLAFALCLSLAVTASADAVTFDFDAGSPSLAPGQTVPFTQTAGGVTASFGSIPGSAFSVQSDATTFYTLSQFSGNYLWSNNVNRNTLTITFDRPLTGVSLTFATFDLHDPGGNPSSIMLSAFADPAGTGLVGTSNAHGLFSGDTYPQGTLLFTSSGGTFSRVEIVVPFQPGGTAGFMVDNITAVTAPDTATVPEPATLALFGAGLLSLKALVRRRASRPRDKERSS